MDKIKITIFVLVYNNFEELDTTINSINSQSVNSQTEVIISDDGSDNYDTSKLELCATMLRRRFPKVTVNVNKKNVGTVKHLNIVYNMAEGEYLISLSSGDRFYASNTVEHIVNKLEKSKALIVTSPRVDVYPGGKSKRRPGKSMRFWLKHNPRKLMNYMIRKKNLISGCCTFYRKSLFEQYGYLDERYHLVEDYTYYTYLLRRNVRFEWLGEVTVFHRMSGVSSGKVHPSIYSDIEMMRSNLLEYKEELAPSTVAFLEKCVRKTQGENNG